MKHFLFPVSVRRAWLFLLGVIALLFVPAARAQGFGSIQGTVSDSTGAKVPNVTIVAVQTETKIAVTSKTNGSGLFVFPSLAPATYSIQLAVPGFERYAQNDVVLLADKHLETNVVLKVGQASEQVSVEATPSTVDLVTGTLSRVVDGEEINELPLNGRNPVTLAALTAGVVIAPGNAADQGDTKTFPGVFTYSVNGSASNQTDYMLDGGNNLDEYTNVNQPFPFPDALQEYSVQTLNYNAEYGQNAGGVVNIVTKSGGSQYHGTAFEYIRNAVFNARAYFTPGAKDPLKRNQYGGTIGGPIKIPGLLSGKHSFFFFGAEKNHITNAPTSSNSYVPTTANLNGDFGALCTTTDATNPVGFLTSGANAGKCYYTSGSKVGTAYTAGQATDPINLTGGKPTPFLYNQIPVVRYDKAALALDKVLAPGDSTGLVTSLGAPTVITYMQYIARVDQQFGEKDHVFGHYFYDKYDHAGFLQPSNLLTENGDSNIVDQSALISETHTFNSHLLNVLTINFSRDNAQRAPPAGAPGPDAFGVNVYVPNPKSIQSVSVQNSFSVGTSQPAIFGRENYTLGNDLHYVVGRHNMAFGVHAEISRVNIQGSTSSGTFTFTSTNTGSAILSYLLGYMSQFGQSTGQLFSGRNDFKGVYGQDSWKINSRLNITYGLRWEPFQPWYEKFHRFTDFDPAGYAAGRASTAFPNAPAGLYFNGDPGVYSGGSYGSDAIFMPRFGFSADPFGTGKTVVRGGGGVFYDSRIAAINYAGVANNNPFALSVKYTYPTGPFSNPYLGLTNPFPGPAILDSTAAFPTPVSVSASPADTPDPVQYSYDLVVEQMFTSRLGLRLAYVGSHSAHIRTGNELNPALQTGFKPNLTNSTAAGVPLALSTGNENARRPYGCVASLSTTAACTGSALAFGSIKEIGRGENATYNALQVTLQQRTARLNFTVNYTFSKALSTAPFSNWVFPIYTPNYKRLDRGPADYDIRQNFTTSVVAKSQFHGGNSLVRAVINDWQASASVSLRTGNTLTPLAGSDVSLTNIGSDRAVFNPSVNPYTGSKRSRFINPAAFTLPVLGDFGNVQKGSFYGPGYLNSDLGVARHFPIYERARGEFRAEFFNILNHPNFVQPSVSLSNLTNFGLLNTQQSDSQGNGNYRTGQLALKIIF